MAEGVLPRGVPRALGEGARRVAVESANRAVEGLRERKKAMMHQLISDTATGMFLERGFDEVKVTEIAEACGVSEKTVYNYFPTKESLMLDRESAMAAAIRHAFGPSGPAHAPVQAALEVLSRDFDEMQEWWRRGDTASGFASYRRFTEIVESTPSLRAAQGEMMSRLADVTAAALAERAGMSPEDPEPQIAAHAILGLWRIQHQAIRRNTDGSLTLDELYEVVTAEVHRAARLLESGLWSFGAMVQGGNSRVQLKAAADAAQQAGRQVAAAVRQARTAWRQLQRDADHDRHARMRR